VVRVLAVRKAGRQRENADPDGKSYAARAFFLACFEARDVRSPEFQQTKKDALVA
jgi:hypothetical protein